MSPATEASFLLRTGEKNVAWLLGSRRLRNTLVRDSHIVVVDALQSQDKIVSAIGQHIQCSVRSQKPSFGTQFSIAVDCPTNPNITTNV